MSDRSELVTRSLAGQMPPARLRAEVRVAASYDRLIQETITSEHLHSACRPGGLEQCVQ